MAQTGLPSRGKTSTLAPIIGQNPLSKRTFSGKRTARASRRSASMARRIRSSLSRFSILSVLSDPLAGLGAGTPRRPLTGADEARPAGHGAVDVDGGPVHVVGFVRCQPHGGARDILRLPDAF